MVARAQRLGLRFELGPEYGAYVRMVAAAEMALLSAMQTFYESKASARSARTRHAVAPDSPRAQLLYRSIGEVDASLGLTPEQVPPRRAAPARRPPAR
jgi:hypothetical protein